MLKVKKQNEKDFLFTIFFRDYGRLVVAKKKKVREKSLDTGYNVNCEVITKEGRNIHTIGNISVSNQFLYEDKPYSEIEAYLSMIKTVATDIPLGVPHSEVYHVLQSISQDKKITLSDIILAHLKILLILGNISPENNNTTVQKILKFVDTHKIGDILKLKGINEDIQKKLEQLL